jgi:hypothetical protein
VDKLHDVTQEALNDPALREKLAKLGVEPKQMSIDQFGEFFREDFAEMLQLAKEAHIEPTSGCTRHRPGRLRSLILGIGRIAKCAFLVYTCLAGMAKLRGNYQRPVMLHTNIEPVLPKRGLNGIMRSTIAACAILVLLIGTVDAEQCPPGALGVSRTLVVDPNEHPRVGSMQYPETLPLNDHEVVLLFDDGPLPRYTNRVLETLASECVKATFFMVGQMARAYPWMVRRVYDDGHTVANHTQNHPIRKMSGLPRSNGLPAPRPNSIRVREWSAHAVAASACEAAAASRGTRRCEKTHR